MAASGASVWLYLATIIIVSTEPVYSVNILVTNGAFQLASTAVRSQGKIGPVYAAAFWYL